MTAFDRQTNVSIGELNAWIYNATGGASHFITGSYLFEGRSLKSAFIKVEESIIPDTPPDSTGSNAPAGGWDFSVPSNEGTLWISMGKTEINGTTFSWSTPVKIDSEIWFPLFLFRKHDDAYEDNFASPPNTIVVDLSESKYRNLSDGWGISIPTITSPTGIIYVAQGLVQGSVTDTHATIEWQPTAIFAQANGNISPANIALGKAGIGAGPCFSNLDIWGAELPNGDFDIPSKMSETYQAEILPVTESLPTLNMQIMQPNFYRTTHIDGDNLKIYLRSLANAGTETDQIPVQNHYIKYTAKLYNYKAPGSKIGLPHIQSHTSKHDFIFPDVLSGAKVNPLDVFNSADYSVSRRLGLTYLNTPMTYRSMHRWAHGLRVAGNYRWNLHICARNNSGGITLRRGGTIASITMDVLKPLGGWSSNPRDWSLNWMKLLMLEEGEFWNVWDNYGCPDWLGEVSFHKELYLRDDFTTSSSDLASKLTMSIYCDASKVFDWTQAIIDLPNDGIIAAQKWNGHKNAGHPIMLMGRYYENDGWPHTLWWYWQEGRWGWKTSGGAGPYYSHFWSSELLMKGRGNYIEAVMWGWTIHFGINTSAGPPHDPGPDRYLYQYDPYVPYDGSPVWWTSHGKGSEWAKWGNKGKAVMNLRYGYQYYKDAGIYQPIKASQHVKWRRPDLDHGYIRSSVLRNRGTWSTCFDIDISDSGRGNIAENPIGRHLADPATILHRSPEIGFDPNGDTTNHIILNQYTETNPNLIPEGYTEVKVQEGLIKIDDATLIGSTETLDIYQHTLKIPMDSSKSNFCNMTFSMEGVTPLGIEKHGSEYKTINGYDFTTGKETFSKKSDAIAHWSNFVYNKRHANKISNVYTDFVTNNFWSHVSHFDVLRDSQGNPLTFNDGSIKHTDFAGALQTYGLYYSYVAAGFSSSNNPASLENDPSGSFMKTLPSKRKTAKIRFYINYNFMIPSFLRKEFENVADFLERLLSLELDILNQNKDWVITVNVSENAEAMGSSNLASAGPLRASIGAFSRGAISYNLVSEMQVKINPEALRNDSYMTSDALGRNSWYNILLHEFCHGLGFLGFNGFGYTARYSGDPNNPYYNSIKLNEYGYQYTEAAGVQAYQAAIVHHGLTDTNKYYYSYLPWQRSGGHIAEFAKTDGVKIQPAFYNELMTPYYGGVLREDEQNTDILSTNIPSSNPFTAISAGVLQDCGFLVDYSITDSFDNLQYNLYNNPEPWEPSYQNITAAGASYRRGCCGNH